MFTVSGDIMEKTTIAATTIVLFSALAGATPLILDQTTTEYQKSTLISSIEVTNNTTVGNLSVGFNADSNMQFGRIPLESNMTKTINLSSEKTVLLNAHVEGNISSVLEHEDKVLFEGNKQLPVKAVTKEPGYYNGTLVLDMQVAQSDIGRKWLEFKSNF